MDNRQRDNQIVAGLEIVDKVVDRLAQQGDKWEPFRDDMRSAATVLLVELVSKRKRLKTKNWDGYLYSALRREAMREAKRLWGAEAEIWQIEGQTDDFARLTEAQRRRAARDRITDVLEERLMTPDVGPAVLAKIDRERALDPGWRNRERLLPFLTAAWWGVRGSQAGWIARDRYIWEARRIWNRPLGEVAREIRMQPYALRKLERRLVARLGA